MKQIIFNTEMVHAIREGRKMVTRRVVKPNGIFRGWSILGRDKSMIQTPNGFGFLISNGEKSVETLMYMPYRPGDVLYARETWQYAYDLDGNEQPIEGTGRYLYAADERPEPFGFWVNPDGSHRDSMPWRPSIHMPREAARIFLRVTDVRVERLQDITNEQALTEGVPEDDDYPLENPVYCPECKGEGLLGTFHPVSLGYMEVDCPYCDTPKTIFQFMGQHHQAKRSRPLRLGRESVGMGYILRAHQQGGGAAMYVTPNYHRYGPGYGFVDAPETYCCAICGNYIDWPAEEIGENGDGEYCHMECLERELWETA